MKILITGGAGFIGSHLSEKMRDLGHNVTIWDNATTGYFIPNDVEFQRIDVTRPGFLGNFDAIYHLAALSRITTCQDNEMQAHNVNVLGTLTMLQIARETKARFIYAATSDIGFNNTYSFTKGLGEEYCVHYRRQYKVPMAIARLFNVYGPRQHREGPNATVIGIFHGQKRKGVPLTISGDGEQRRDFVHVADVVDAFVRMLECDGNFQIGSGKAYSINEVAKMFNHPFEHIPARKGEMKVTWADMDSTQETLGWSPKLELEAYIRSLDEDTHPSSVL